MNTENKASHYTFTVKRISDLQKLLSRADKNTVNKFITEIRYSVTTYHAHQYGAANNKKIKSHQQFFSQLNDKAHQLGRFTLQLSELVNKAPSELSEAAIKADRNIDKIHGNLVDLCLTIDALSQQKSNFYHDASQTVKDIYSAYCKVFNVIPSGRAHNIIEDLPNKAPLEDLLVPVVELLLLKDNKRCYTLVQAEIKKRAT